MSQESDAFGCFKYEIFRRKGRGAADMRRNYARNPRNFHIRQVGLYVSRRFTRLGDVPILCEFVGDSRLLFNRRKQYSHHNDFYRRIETRKARKTRYKKIFRKKEPATVR